MGNEMGGESELDAGKVLDPLIAHARAKAEALGLAANIGEILCADSEEEADKRGARLGAMGAAWQLVTYALSALYAADENVRTAAQRTLSPVIESWGLPEDFVDQYIKWGEAATARFELEHEEQATEERRRQIREATKEFAFNAVRDYLRSE